MRVYKDESLISESVRNLTRVPREVFLLDVSWHLHRCSHTFKNFTAGPGGRPTGHMYGFLHTVQMLRDRFPDSLIVLCKDGVPVRRQKIMEDQENAYKADRPELEFNIYQDYNLILASLSLLGGVVEAFIADQESDDLMSNLARQITHVSPESKIFVYSGDDDLLQTIDDDHVWVIRKFDRGSPILIDNLYIKMDERMLTKFHGVDSYHLPYYRSICGDHSDKLGGIPRFNRDAAKKIAMDAERIDDLFVVKPQHIDDGTKKYREILMKNEALVRRNFSLMALRDEFKVDLKVYNPPVDVVKRKLRQYYLNGYLSYLSKKGI